MAAFDPLKEANRKTYGRLMANMIDPAATVAVPRLAPAPGVMSMAARTVEPLRRNGHAVLGIVAGTGARWPKKMLPPERVAILCHKAAQRSRQVKIVLLSGSRERDRIGAIMRDFDGGSVSALPTGNDLPLFAALISQCDALVTGGYSRHLGTAFGIPMIVLHAPTSGSEMDNSGQPLTKFSADLPCLCCYGDCNRTDDCITELDLDLIAEQAVAYAMSRRSSAGLTRVGAAT
jgi:ADP-heptose:LPS heptosyltransferase